MVLKMALNNVRKSYKDYTVYFMTLAFSVALFYVFGSFEDQSSILELGNHLGRTLELVSQALNVISVIVVIIFAFLIVYANNFIIGRRKQEFGLYMLLGMSRFKMSWILILETFLIGLVALMMGLFAGYILTQLTGVLMGRILAVPIHYQFIFSKVGAVRTIACFSGIFMLVMVLNQRRLRKITLNELFNALRTNENLTSEHIGWTVFQLFGAIAMLVFDYLWVLQAGQLIFYMPIIVGIGIFGTILLFKSLAGFVEYFIRLNQKHYYKSLNLFVIRQVSTKIRSTYRVMAVVSITLLFGITILTTGLNVNQRISHFAEETIPYDCTFTYMYDDPGMPNEYFHRFGFEQSFTQGFQINLYRSDAFRTRIFEPLWVLTGQEEPVDEPLGLLSVEDYNKVRRMQGKPDLRLKQGDLYYQPDYNNIISLRPKMTEVLDYQQPLIIGSKAYDLKPYDNANFVMFSNQSNGYPIIVANDSDLNDIKGTWPDIFIKSIVSGDVLDKSEQNIDRIIDSVATQQSSDKTNYYSTEMLTIYNAGLTGMGTEIIIAAIGLYIGIVLLVVSLVILALQQLSEASDNQKRYHILRKLGVSNQMIHSALLKQTALYFFIPLGVALVHTVVGLIAIDRNLSLLNLGQASLELTITTVMIIFILYLIYFMTTYLNSKRIINSK